MLNIQPGDVNKLRELLAAGLIREEDISSGSFGPSAPPQQNALARILSDQEQFAAGDQSGALPMGSMRNEETGRVTYFKPGGGGFSDRPYPAQGQIPEQAKRQKVRLVGMGNDGSQTDLGEEDARALPIDYTRPGIDLPGLGKARYTADGRYAVVSNPDGSQTKVVLGYDAAASDRRTLRDLKMREMSAQASEAEARAGLLQDKRTMLAAGPQQADASAPLDQKELERIHGKPDKGYRWTQDGTQEPLPGGEIVKAAQTAAEKAADAISQIDALIGGEGRAPHAGFESAVGVSIPKALGAGFIPGTDTSNFNKRLEQLKGGAFLEAFQTLKGGGQITEVEGRKATAAITRMDTAQSEPEFIEAAKEFRSILERGLAKARAMGGAAPAAKAPDFSAGGQGAASVPPPEQRRLGQAYDTPRGRLIWLGNGWRAP